MKQIGIILIGVMFTATAAAAIGASSSRANEPARLSLQKGDHISIIGNTLADRMQHHGWLETLIHNRFPRDELVFRNLGYSGDELTLRLRSASFGSPDEWLSSTSADVIFAFFGYNESFAGEAGLDKFKRDLGEFISHTRGQKYNNKSAPRLVLFSPIAHENLKDPNLPDGKANNDRIRLYTAAMAAVAESNAVMFVDLFDPTLPRRKLDGEPLTINGIHLNEQGDRTVAMIIDRKLFGEPVETPVGKLQKLRSAVLEKNFFWFQRYRTVDGYSIYGGRADLKFTDGQTNRDVMQREMQVLDVMTANRDRRIWAVAQGKDLTVDDTNTPPFIPVVSNKPGPLEGGKHVFLGGEEAIGKMTVAKGMKVNLFASEEMFPEMVNPVQMAFDTRGRLWVAVWPTYPHWKPKEEMNDKLLILEDTDGDGKADKCSTFADDLHCPTGFEFWNGGVLVAQAPDLMFLKDTNGGDKADHRERVIHGLDSADTHHTSNSFTLDPGGALYFQEGTFHHTQVETPYGPPERCANAGVFRYEPRTQRFEVFVSYGFANPHGHVWDRWGQNFVTDGTGNVNYYETAFSGHVDFPSKHPNMEPYFRQRTRPCPGTEILSSRHFPDELQGNLLDADVIQFQGILQYKFRDDGSGFAADEGEPILRSTDPNFRPTDMEIGPDGALYFGDWQNPIIGHMQHNLRDPNRDREHGRVYRVTYPSRPLLKPATIAGAPIDKLLDLLKEPENRVRYRAKIELSGRASADVVPAVNRWVAKLDKNDLEYEHHMLEALWVHQHHNAVNVELLKRELASSDYRARAAATRVLCYWRDRVPDSLGLLKQLAADPYPRVRLEAIRAASFFTVPEAVEVPLIAAEFPTDYYLDYTRGETMKTLEQYWKRALAENRPIPVTSEAGARFFLRNRSTEQLLKMERTRSVNLELLFRPGLLDDQRRDALRGLAKLDNKSDLRVLVDAIHSMDNKTENRDESVVFDLVRLLSGRNAAELAVVRADLEKLATAAKQPVIRQIGFVAIMSVDGNVDNAWRLGAKSVASLTDLVNAVPLISDGGMRASLYSQVEPLLTGLPPELARAGAKSKGSHGRFIRIELPGNKRTLTLAEVEVFSDGRNVAARGKAAQKNTAHGGDAKKAIDGNRAGLFSMGGQTHTQENTDDPWWELDLGEELPIENIVIYNRTDGDLGKRLEGFTLKLLDSNRNEVFKQERVPAPTTKVEFRLAGGGPEGIVRRAAMNALVSVRGQESKTFQILAKFVHDDVDRLAAIRAMQRIPRTHWPKESAKPLLDVLTAHVRSISVSDRTSPAALDALEFADALATLLPPDLAKQIRADLGELGVRVIRIGTLLERMSYDKDLIAVRAGKPVEFIFENSDLMPHNFVITQPGSLEEIGQISEATVTDPRSAERHYVPLSNKVLLASRLLLPRESQKLSFTAPSQPGVYPYVCTFPGHWRRMVGALYVVENLDDYLANPEAYLASHQLPIQDDLLKDTRPRTEWKFEDLAVAVEQLSGGRSYGNGRHLFEVASCVACHRRDGVGNEFGADLTKLDAKLKPVDILKDVLEPSFRINEKYQTYVIETSSGKILTGIVLEETPQMVKIIENPLAKAEPVLLKPSEIAERKKSPTSIMPKGLLDKLTRDEILDLVAYIASRGDRNHELFHSEHQHGPGH